MTLHGACPILLRVGFPVGTREVGYVCCGFRSWPCV